MEVAREKIVARQEIPNHQFTSLTRQTAQDSTNAAGALQSKLAALQASIGLLHMVGVTGPSKTISNLDLAGI